uniref:Tropomyosin n=1 Tax=Steinernema glaseri TaxID=37863 RepID=A0A1I7ZCH1_9BILA
MIGFHPVGIDNSMNGVYETGFQADFLRPKTSDSEHLDPFLSSSRSTPLGVQIVESSVPGPNEADRWSEREAGRGSGAIAESGEGRRVAARTYGAAIGPSPQGIRHGSGSVSSDHFQVLFCLFAAAAPTPYNPPSAMDAIKKKMQAMKIEKDNALDRADAAEEKVRQMQEKLERVEEELRDTQKKMVQVENDCDKAQEDLANANTSLEEKEKKLQESAGDDQRARR